MIGGTWMFDPPIHLLGLQEKEPYLAAAARAVKKKAT